MTIRDVVGSVSAGTLGYITGNTRGARRAIALYRNYENMRRGSTSETRGRSRSRTPHATKKRGASSMSIGSSKRFRSRSRVSFARSVASSSSANNVLAKASKKKGHKVAKEGLKKKIQVPLKLRKQIKQVVHDTPSAVGRYTDIKYFTITPTDSQVITMLGNTTETKPNLFDPAWINYVASTLFNGAAVTFNPTLALAKLFSTRTLKVEVLKQNVIYRMMNNTQRTLTVKIWDLSPKSRQYNQGFDPLAYWTGSFSNEAVVPNNPNKYFITPQTLYAHPKMSEAFRNMYSLDETIIQLEAGKEYVHKLNGPNMVYDFQKFWDQGTFSNQQKFIKHTMICVYCDLINTTLATPGRFTDIVAADPNDLIIEQTTFTKIRMPEQVGYTVPTPVPIAGDIVPMNQRYSCYAIQNWAGSQAGTVSKIEDENPVTAATGTGT